MFKSGKPSLSSFNQLFRLLIAAIFLIGILPVPALASTDGTIAGQVTDNTTGNPIPDVTVGILETEEDPPIWEGHTDVNGNYSASVPEGTGYVVGAVSDGYIAAFVTGQSVTVNATTTVNLSLVPGATIQGTVTDNSTQNPIQNADVWAYKPETPEVRYETLPTDASGHYNLTVPSGTGYTVKAAINSYVDAVQTGVNTDLASPATVNLALDPMDSTPPAKVNDLATSNPTHNSITLTWTAPGDDGTNDQASQYEIRHASVAIDTEAKWNAATIVPNPPTPNAAGSSENFTVRELSDNTTYYFALKTADEIPNWSDLSNPASATTITTPNFIIAHSQNRYSFMLEARGNITESFDISSINNFEGTVELSFHGPPELEDNSSLTPNQVSLTAGEKESVTLTLGASATTPSGTYHCALEGQTTAYEGQHKEAFFTVIVGVADEPLLSASPNVVAAGGQTSFFASQFAPSENVTLRWDSGPKVGTAEEVLATGQIDENGNWNTSVNIPEDMPGGNFAVEARSASSAAVFHLTIISGSEPDFIMSTSPEFISIEPGNSANVTVYVTSINDFSAPVALGTVSPPAVICNLSTSSVTPPIGDTASATLTITVAEWASPDMLYINVEGTCTDPPINKMVDFKLDIPPPAEWGPGISLSQSHGQAGDTISITGSNFPPSTDNQTVTISGTFYDTPLETTPANIIVNNGSFTGKFTIPSGVSSGNYRIEARVLSTGDFAERDFQILGTGETFTLEVSPQTVTVATEEGENSGSTSVNIFDVDGSGPSVNLVIEGAPSWLTYRFGSLPDNTPASGNNSISVPAGDSATRNLFLTVSMTAPIGTYSITIKGWEDEGPEQRVTLELTVQPPAGFGMAQLTLSPTFGSNGQKVTFSGSGFTDCNPGEVTELEFGNLDILAGQNLPTITVPQSGSSNGKFSGSFRVPAVLPPGTYFVDVGVGNPPDDKFISKQFTITDSNDTFAIQASQSFLWAEQNSQISTMIKVQAVGSSSANVSLSVEGCPADITASFTSGNVTAPPGSFASTDLNLNISNWIANGHYTITVKGQRINGAEVHRIPLEIDVVPPAGFEMASIYLNPTVGPPGTWINISGSGFPASTNMTHLYFGPPNSANDWVVNQDIPPTTTSDLGALPSVALQVPYGLTAGMYPVEVVVGNPPYEKRAMSEFTLVSDQASFNINLPPAVLQAAPGDSAHTSVNVQSVGTSSANVTLRVEGPPNIDWRFDEGTWQAPITISPPIGSTLTLSLEVQPKASTPMGRYSLAVKASAGEQQEMRNLELEVGAAADYGMPMFWLKPSNGSIGTKVDFSGSNFLNGDNVTRITFGGDNITLAESIPISAEGSFSGAFIVPSTVGGQATAPGTYTVRVTVDDMQAEAHFNVYGSDDTFTINLSPNYVQGKPGDDPFTSGILKALSGASPTVKMAVRGLPPNVNTLWNGDMYPFYTLSTPPGGQNNFNLTLQLPDMISMGQYPAVLEGWVDTNDNNLWDEGEDICRVNLELAIMPPQGYGMGMFSLNPSYGQVGDTISFSGTGFPEETAVTSLTFADTNVLTKAITTSDNGSFSGVFTVPGTAFGMDTGPGTYPVDVTVGTYPNDIMGYFEFQIVTSDQKFSISASPHWLVRPAGDTGYANINVRSLVATPPSPNVIIHIEGLPWGVIPSFTTANITPPVGDMESRELRLDISDSCPAGNYPISIRAYNAATPTEELWYDFTLEVTPSSDFMDMGMATLTISNTFGSAGDSIIVSGYGFPKNQNLTYIHLGPDDVTPTSVDTVTDDAGDFSAVITVPNLCPGFHPLEVNVNGTIRSVPFDIMGADATYSLKVSPGWLEPIPAGDSNGRQIAITVDALTGKTPTVTLSTEGLFAAYGTIEQVWNPLLRTVNVTSAGGTATATLTLIPSENLPPGPYPFNIIAIDNNDNRRDFHMDFTVGPPTGYSDSMMGMDESEWSQQWEDTEWENGIYFPEIRLSPSCGPAGTVVTYTGTKFPAGANVTSIRFAGQTVPLPATGVSADNITLGFSGSFIVDEAWKLTPGMYGVEFYAEMNEWSQHIMEDFILMRSDAKFSLEVNPDWIPPIPPGSLGQTQVTVKALGYTSVNVTLGVMETFGGGHIPGGAQAHWGATDGSSTTNVTAPGAGQTSESFYLEGAEPGYYWITIVGWIDSNGNQVLDKDIQSESESAFSVPLDFEVEPPQEFMTMYQGFDDMMSDLDMDENDKYLFYFPEIKLDPNIGPTGTKVTVRATNFPAGAIVTHLRFAGVELPVPPNTVTDNATSGFSLVFNVPKTMWESPTLAGWYGVEVEAQIPDEPAVFIVKPFQVTSSDVAFTLRAEPDFLPPIPQNGSSTTTIWIKSTGASVNVTLSVDKIPPGVGHAFSPSSQIIVPPGGTGSATLILTPTNIPPGHYHAEIMGTATVDSNYKEFHTHIEFEVEPPMDFMDWDRDDMMTQMGTMNEMDMAAEDWSYMFYFPEITLKPNVGKAGTKVEIEATNFPTSANVAHLRFAGKELPVPLNKVADNVTGDFTLFFNVPKTLWNDDIRSGWYNVEVEAQKPGEHPVNIMKPFQVTASDVAFTLKADPDWLPPIPPSGSNTTILINSMGAGANVDLSVDKIPPGITASFYNAQVNIPPGGSGSSILTLTPGYISPGHYGAEIKGTATVDGNYKEFYTHFEFEVEPPMEFMDWNRDDMMNRMGTMNEMDMAAEDWSYMFYFPEIMLNPSMGKAGTKVTIQATDFPAGANVTHLRFAGMELPVPLNKVADNVTGDFTLVFNVPKKLWGDDIHSGWYDVEVEAEKPGEHPVFIMKPFQVTASDVTFTLRAEPDWLPPIPPCGSNTTIQVTSMGAAANVTLTVDKIPPGITTTFSHSQVTLPPGGSSSSLLTLTPTNIPPGHYGAEIRGTATIDGNYKEFYTHLEFEVEPPQEFMTMYQDFGNMMDDLKMDVNDKYLFYFPEITLKPNTGKAGTKVTIEATNFPGGANVTHLRFAGMELPVPDDTTANITTGKFNLVFNVPKKLWGDDIHSGWYDVEVEAQKVGEPAVFIMKPFQVNASDVAFTFRADPDWLPPIPPSGSNTTIRVTSMGAAANVTLTVDKIPPGITTTFSSSQVNLPPGGSGSSVLTLTPTNIPPGHYGAEIRGTATIDGTLKEFYTHLEFEVEPPQEFMDTDWMAQQGVWFPEITLNPNAGLVKTKVSVKATDFPVGAEVTRLRFAGRELPVPDGTTADINGDFNLVFNVPSDFGVGHYMVEVEAEKTGMPPVFIAKPFFIEDSGVSFKLDVVPGFIPGVEQGDSGNTTIFVKSTGRAVTIDLYVDGLPPGATATFDSDNLSASPGGSSSTILTITTKASTPPGHYPLTIRGASGTEERMIPFGLGVTPPATFQMPKLTLEPDFAPAGYTDKKYKVTFSGTGFPRNKSVASIEFGSQPVAIPDNLRTDPLGNLNGVFQMPTGLDPGTYDVMVAVATGDGGYVYDSRPFSIRGADAKFILKPSPPYLPPIIQSGNGTTVVNVRSVGTTTANVTLYVDGLAPGITAAFSPSNVVRVSPGDSGSATLTLTVGNNTPPGPYPLSIRGVSGNESVVVPLGFSVMPNIGGGEGHATITINPPRARPGEHIGISGAGFINDNTVNLTAAPPGAPTGIDITPGTIQVQTDGTWATEITIPEAGQVPPGSYIIKANDGTRATKSPFNIVPASNADFFLNVSPPFIEVVQGESGNTTMSLSSKNGFKEAVRFSVGHLAPGVTATFKDTAGNTIGKFSGTPGGIREVIPPTALTPVPGEDLTITTLIDVDLGTPIGPYDIALEAETGTIFRAVPLGLMVVSPGASLVISPMSGPADTDIRLSGSGFTAGETVTVTFAGTSITTIPSIISVAEDGTFTAVITAPSMTAGIHPVSVTGTISGIMIDRPFGLKPSAVNTFVLYASPQKVDIPKDRSSTITTKIEPLGSFQSPVTLSISGLSAIAGATANITPSSTVTPSIATPTTATLTINVPSVASEGKYPLVITGTSGAITQTRKITVKVVPPANTPDFAISLAPDTVPISPSATGNTTVTIASINDFSGTVDLAVTMSDATAAWPSGVSYTTGTVTPSVTTGLGKQAVIFTIASGTQPGNWAFKITGTSGALEHSTEVMVICTPSGTTITPYASPRLDPTTITTSTPVDMEPPWGDKIQINGLINDGSEASVITPSKVDVTPSTLASLPDGASDMLGRVTNVESSAPVDGVEWNLGFPFDSNTLAAAGFDEDNLKVAYLNPDTGTWTEVTTTVDTTNKIAYASPDHFSSWTLIATPAPPPSTIVTTYSGGGGGGGGGASGVTSVAESTTSSGRFVEEVTAESADGNVEVSIPENTIGKNRAGQPLYSISIKPKSAPSAPPADSEIIGLVYDFGPGGATFDPPISLTFTYKESLIPAGATEENLVIATWDDEKWLELEGSAVDPDSNTITAPVSHFSIFTVMAHTSPATFEISAFDISPAVIYPGESVTISATITNTGELAGSHQATLMINDGVTAIEEVSLAGHTSQQVNFTLKPQKAGSYAVNVNGLSATFIVREALAETSEERPTPSETPVITAEAQPSQPEATLAPSEAQPRTSGASLAPSEVQPITPEVPAAPPAIHPTPSVPPAEPAPLQISFWLIISIVAGGFVIGIVIWRLVASRRAS